MSRLVRKSPNLFPRQLTFSEIFLSYRALCIGISSYCKRYRIIDQAKQKTAIDREKNHSSQEHAVYLFVYGTLLQGFENAHFLASPHKARFWGYGTIPGRLYDLGPFPGYHLPASTPESQPERVKGEIYQILDPEVVFETLDLIEGYNQKQPEKSLFIRKRVTAYTDHGECEVWVYVYNQPLLDSYLIKSGDYRAYRRIKPHGERGTPASP